jgi:hypothetical protein
MDVTVEGILVLDNLDVFAKVGGNAAYVYTVPQSIAVNDGFLTIAFIPSKQNPMISGIEVLPAPPPSPLFRINCGSTAQVIDSNSVAWGPDQYFNNIGSLYSTCGSITNSIYCTSRYFRATSAPPFRYEIPVPVSNAPYQLRLHFAEQVRDLIHFDLPHFWISHFVNFFISTFAYPTLDSITTSFIICFC